MWQKKLRMGTIIMIIMTERTMTNYGKINFKEGIDNMFPVINLKETGINLSELWTSEGLQVNSFCRRKLFCFISREIIEFFARNKKIN